MTNKIFVEKITDANSCLFIFYFSYISKKDLYIHLRSGDIYKKNAHGKYSQPPLCFYSNILNNFNFGNIYLISNDNNNPIINRLTKKYNNII